MDLYAAWAAADAEVAAEAAAAGAALAEREAAAAARATANAQLLADWAAAEAEVAADARCAAEAATVTWEERALLGDAAFGMSPGWRAGAVACIWAIRARPYAIEAAIYWGRGAMHEHNTRMLAAATWEEHEAATVAFYTAREAFVTAWLAAGHDEDDHGDDCCCSECEPETDDDDLCYCSECEALGLSGWAGDGDGDGDGDGYGYGA